MYGVIVEVPAPIEMYDVSHAEIVQQMGTSADGLIVHLARPRSGGFQIIEIWNSKEQCDRFNDQVVAPIVQRLSAGQAPPREQISEEFDVRGLVIPQANVVI